MSYFELPSRFLLFICKFKQINYLGGGGWGEQFFSAIMYSYFCCFCLKEQPLPLVDWKRMCYSIMALGGVIRSHIKVKSKMFCQYN